MTKSEVRAIVLSKLEFAGGDIFLDVGAGTGSVSVEAAFCRQVLAVYAFERREEALEILAKNREKAGALGEKIRIAAGTAPESFPGQFIGKPTHAFIGGSSGNLEGIVSRLLELNPGIRVVMTAISLETLSEALTLLKKREIEAEIVSVQIARGRTAGSYHLMEGLNPVYVISFGGPA